MATLRMVSGGVQRGALASTTGTSVSTDLGAAVTLSKSILLFSYQGGSTTPETGSVRGYFVDTDTITFEWDTTITSTGINIDIQWEVLEFDSGVVVEHKQVSGINDADTVAITTIDQSTSFLIHSGCSKGGSTFSGDDQGRIYFSSSSEVTLEMAGNTPTDYNIAFQVVDIDDSAVQVVTSTKTTTTEVAYTETASAFTDNKTFFFGSIENDTAGGFDDLLWCVYTADAGAGQIRVERNTGASQTITYTVYIVELTEGTGGPLVTKDAITIASGTADGTDDFTPAVSDTDFSVVSVCGLVNGWPHPITDRTVIDFNTVFARLTFVDTNTINVDRDSGASSAATWNYWVLEVPVASSGQTMAPTFVGTGALTTVFQVNVPMSPTLAGTGALTLVTQVDSSFAPTFAGTGVLSIVSAVDVPFSPTLAGVGELAIVFDVGGVSFAPTFAGTGTLAIVSSVDVPMSPTFAGTGTLVVVATTDAVQTTAQLFGRYVVYDPTALGETALRKIAYLRQRER